VTKQKLQPSAKQSAVIDWGAIHRRLEAARVAIEQGSKPSPEEQQKILKARARALQQEPQAAVAAKERMKVVEFLLADERYGLESSFVREVYPLKDLTPVPCTPPFVLGIINVRGQILSVIDLKKLFDLPEKGLTDLNKVIIVRAGQMELGILADRILGVRSIPLAEVQPTLPTLIGIRAEYLTGVTSERLVILDVGKMLSEGKMIVHEEVES